MSAMKHEGLVQFLQEGKIGHFRSITEGDNTREYLEWYRSHGTDPSDESVEFYVEQTDIGQVDRQMMNDKGYGIWN